MTPSTLAPSLAGKVALCTGAGRRGGLGEAICRALAEAGCQVALSDRAVDGCADSVVSAANVDDAKHAGGAGELEGIVASICEAGGKAIGLPLDVRDEAQVIDAVASTVRAFGRLDILINNAGIGYRMQPLCETSRDSWAEVLEVNLTGSFLCTKHAALRMIEQGSGGRIVNIASQAAKSGHAHLAAYSSSKHGMVGLTRSAAIELGPHRITVNAICPNHVTTGLGAVQNEYFAKLRGFASAEDYLDDMQKRIPLRRVGLTTDTAQACLFLCSDAAAYITGEAMNVSGGLEMH